jgi:hypothetical protein
VANSRQIILNYYCIHLMGCFYNTVYQIKKFLFYFWFAKGPYQEWMLHFIVCLSMSIEMIK